MKYFKKFLLLGIFTLFGVSFCSAGQIVYSGHYVRANASYNKYYANSSFLSIPSPYYDIQNYTMDFDCSITNYQYTVGDIFADFTPTFKFYLYTNSSSLNNINLTTFSFNNGEASFSGTVPTFNSSNFVGSNFSIANTVTFEPTVCVAGTNCSYSFDFVCTFVSDGIFGGSSSCDYSEYESQISTLQSQLNTATGSLATCNSNLSSCNTSLNTATGSLATCQSNLNTATGSLATCQSNLNIATGSLATCQNDLTSCQNNSSSSSSSCEATGYISDYISGNILFSGSKSFGSAGYTNMFNYGDYGAGTYCLKFSSTSPQTLSMGFANGGTTAPTNLYSLYNDQYGNWICLYGNKPYLNVKLNSSSNTINYEVYKLTDLLGTQFQCPVQDLSGYILESSVNSQYCVNNGLCPSCPDQYTSLQCQEEYNLIPINDINENYCTLNFDLISPSDCPSSPSGSGTSRSALYVNNVQYLGSPSIYVNIPEIIDRNYTYNSGNMILDVEGYNVNTGYMADILTIQEYHPSSEDFTVAFVSFLTLVLPYVIVTLFVIFVRRLLRKIFKS